MDTADLEAIYNTGSVMAPCETSHRGGEIVFMSDEGCYRICCPDCGLFLITSEDGARYLGWLE